MPLNGKLLVNQVNEIEVVAANANCKQDQGGLVDANCAHLQKSSMRMMLSAS